MICHKLIAGKTFFQEHKSLKIYATLSAILGLVVVAIVLAAAFVEQKGMKNLTNPGNG